MSDSPILNNFNTIQTYIDLRYIYKFRV